MAKKQIDSPGLARMRKRLGKAGTETLRRAVLKDQRTAKKKVRRKNPARLFAAADTITVMVPDAPKVGDSARRFSLLCSGMTVADFVAAGGRRRDVRRALKRGHIQIHASGSAAKSVLDTTDGIPIEHVGNEA